ncbi:hypothetical protein [Amnibacterium setariae]|uniref:Uncharacterized protein n=1 Tax=Amnibacterium setariae TaxID=2306585 RepID=A0A3A1TXP2_9MICO|nr:hypothetical protein [Amnibacterium setariae]RIX26479.1 hypothetical protein D1781_16215 [Amnibacterium setariae]
MAIPEAGRLAGHVLLDAVAAWDPSAELEVNGRALNLALERLGEIGAVEVHVDNAARSIQTDASNLVGPAVQLLLHAVQLAALRGPSEQVVIADLRRGLDAD